jgi:hypothetical protein
LELLAKVAQTSLKKKGESGQAQAVLRRGRMERMVGDLRSFLVVQYEDLFESKVEEDGGSLRGSI